MATAELELSRQQPGGFLAMPSPMQAVELVKERYAAIRKIKEDLMQPGVHYGHVGLTGDPKKDKDKKPALFQPGAQVLCAVFGLEPEENLEACIERWDDAAEVFLYYRFKFNMRMNGKVVGTGQGSCNSKEVKYRYRDSSRKCPECGAEAIKKSKFPDQRSGRMEWYCYAKIGGCGAKFDEADPAIVGQEVGKRINPDIGEQANPILKMAHKRAFIAAVLMATMASEFFAQDPEFDPDLKGKRGAVEEPEYHGAPPPFDGDDEPQQKQQAQDDDPAELKDFITKARGEYKVFEALLKMFKANNRKATEVANGVADNVLYSDTLQESGLVNEAGLKNLSLDGRETLVRLLYTRLLKMAQTMKAQMDRDKANA